MFSSFSLNISLGDMENALELDDIDEVLEEQEGIVSEQPSLIEEQIDENAYKNNEEESDDFEDDSDDDEDESDDDKDFDEDWEDDSDDDEDESDNWEDDGDFEDESDEDWGDDSDDSDEEDLYEDSDDWGDYEDSDDESDEDWGDDSDFDADLEDDEDSEDDWGDYEDSEEEDEDIDDEDWGDIDDDLEDGVLNTEDKLNNKENISSSALIQAEIHRKPDIEDPEDKKNSSLSVNNVSKQINSATEKSIKHYNKITKEENIRTVIKDRDSDTQEKSIHSTDPINKHRTENVINGKTKNNTNKKLVRTENKQAIVKDTNSKRKTNKISKEQYYSSLDIDTLYEKLKVFLDKRGIKHSVIDRSIADAEFGVNNINRLIMKNYIVILKGKITISKY